MKADPTMSKKKKARKTPRVKRNPATRTRQSTGSPRTLEYKGLPDCGCLGGDEDTTLDVGGFFAGPDWNQLTWGDILEFPLSLPVFSVGLPLQDTAMPLPIPAPGWEAHPKVLARKVSEGWTAILGEMTREYALHLKPYSEVAILEDLPRPWPATEGVALSEGEAFLIPRLPELLVFFSPGGSGEVGMAFHPAYPADEYSVLLMIAGSSLVFFMYPNGGDKDPLLSESALRGVGDALGAAILNAEGAAFSAAMDRGQGLACHLLREQAVRRVEISSPAPNTPIGGVHP